MNVKSDEREAWADTHLRRREGKMRLFLEETPPDLWDSPANWRLLDALMEAHAAAREVDKEREAYATGLSEVLECLAQGVSEEIRRAAAPCRNR